MGGCYRLKEIPENNHRLDGHNELLKEVSTRGVSTPFGWS